MARKVRRPASPDDLRRARNRGIIYGLMGVVAIIFVIVLVSYLRVTGGPALPPEVRQRIQAEQRQGKAPGDQARPSSTAVPPSTPPLRKQVEQAQQAVRSGDTSERTLYVTDSELNDEIAGAVRQHQEVKDVKAYFGEGRGYLVTRVEVRGQSLTITLTLRPIVSEGAVQFEIESAHVGRMPAPERLVAAARQQLQQKGSIFRPEKTGVYVEKVQIKPGVAILTGRPVARQ